MTRWIFTGLCALACCLTAGWYFWRTWGAEAGEKTQTAETDAPAASEKAASEATLVTLSAEKLAAMNLQTSDVRRLTASDAVISYSSGAAAV